ncbi:hypothetical protein UYO_0020 [Lachnospiraceae bacterium JC7]|nr:hypothetical protein UYO_0020 [Lachnospiraceae bacterium JC7]
MEASEEVNVYYGDTSTITVVNQMQKERMFMEKKTKQILGILFSLVLMLGLLPGMSLTSYADDPYEDLKKNATEITFDGKPWYLIDYDTGTVTLLAKECVGASVYNSNNSYVEYSNSIVKTAVDTYYSDNISADAKAAVSGSGMFLLTRDQATTLRSDGCAAVLKCSQYAETTANFWWLCSPGGYSEVKVSCVRGDTGDVTEDGVDANDYTFGVRPALQLDLSNVIYNSKSKKFILKQDGYTVTYKVVNGTWSDGSTTDQTEVVASGSEPVSVPTGMKASDGYTGGAWDTNPANATITEATTFTYTFDAKAAAHTHELKHVDAKEPTCEEDGYEAHYECTVEGCGEWFEDDTRSVPIDKETFIKKATGHKWDKGVVTQEATYDETGIKTYTCTKCNATKEETIPKKTRSYSDSSDSSSDSDSGSSGNKTGSISTKSVDLNGNIIQTQMDSGAPVSDTGGNWGNENLSWTYTKSDGNLAKSEWLNLEYNGHTYWYYFDDSTIMQTDWFNYNGATYYFVPEMDGWRGRMATGWQQIGDKWYYFETTLGASQGQMYRGAMTPDGHVVGADGAWDGNGTAPVGAIHTGIAVIGS